MKALVRTIFLGLVLSGLQVGMSQAAPVTAPAQHASPADYYSGLATGQGHRSHWASEYGTGTPGYEAAIDEEYLRASRALQSARSGGDTNEEYFWLGYIDGLERSPEEDS